MAFIQHYDKAASALAHAEAHAFQATRSLSADEAAQFAQIASVEALIAQVHATLALAQATMKSSSPPREAAVESQLYADLQDGTPPFPVTIGGERKS